MDSADPGNSLKFCAPVLKIKNKMLLKVRRKCFKTIFLIFIPWTLAIFYLRNHKIIRIGMGLWRSNPTKSLSPKAGSHPSGLWMSPERKTPWPPGQLFQCSDTITESKFSLVLRWNFLGFSLWPLLLDLSLGTTEDSLAPTSGHSPLRYCLH